MSHEKSTEVMKNFIRAITTPELKPVTEAVQTSRELICQRIDELEKSLKRLRQSVETNHSKLNDIPLETTSKIRDFLISQAELGLSKIKEHNSLLTEQSAVENEAILKKISFIHSDLKTQLEASLADFWEKENAASVITQKALYSRISVAAVVLGFIQIIVAAGLFVLLRH